MSLNGSPFYAGAFGRIRPGIMIFTAIPACIWLSCGFMRDMISPIEPSTAPVTGTVIDSVFLTPSAGVKALLDGEETVTGKDGRFVFTAVRTGVRELELAGDPYAVRRLQLTVPLAGLDAVYKVVRANSPPAVESFSCKPCTTGTIDDTVTFTFSACDSSGGIDLLRMTFGDSVSWDSLLPAVTRATGTVSHVFAGAGLHDAELLVAGGGDSSLSNRATVLVSANIRPSISSLRIDSFFVDKEGYLQVNDFDPDSDLACRVIDWGDDSTETDSLFSPSYWHVYHSSRTAVFRIAVSVFDKHASRRDTSFSLTVRKMSTPRVDPVLSIKPGNILFPSDDTVQIGVIVRSVDNYVAQIVWIVNQGQDSAQLFGRYTLTREEGMVPSGIGRLFAYTFSTETLRANNDVRVIVTDGNQLDSTVTGSFSIIGK